MLDIQDPNAIAAIVDESCELLRPHFEKMDELEHWLRSRGYGDEFDGSEDWPENVPYSFFAMLMPRMTHSAPRFTFQGGGSKKLREQVLGLQAAQNIIAKQTRMNQALQPAAMDYLLGFTCLYVDCESQPRHRLTPAQRRKMKGDARYVPPRTGKDYKKPAGQPRYYDSATPLWPMADHLVRHSYGWDQRAKTWAKVRFFWHDVVEDLEDLLARADADPDHWDREAILRLAAVRSSDNPYDAAASKETEEQVTQVRYRMVWVPGARITEEAFDAEGGQARKVVEPGEHEHGVWLTLGTLDATSGEEFSPRFGDKTRADQSSAPTRSEYLAKPFYRRGSRNSPYKVLGAHIPASKTVPFSPLTSSHEQIRLWNDLAASVQRRMRRYKRQLVYDLRDASMIDDLIASEDDAYVGISGFETAKAQVVETGGVGQQDVAHLQMSQQTTYRALGMSETLQGNATNQTATAESYAAQSGLQRIGQVVAGWENLLSDVAEEMAWHMAYTSTFWVVLDEAAKIEMALADMAPFIEAGLLDARQAESVARQAAEREIAVWQGGDFADDPELDFGLMSIEIEPWSMERRDIAEQRQDVLALIPMVAEISNLVVQQPHFEWKSMLRILGRVFRQPDLEKMLHMDIAQQLSQLALAQGPRDVHMEAAMPSGVQRMEPGRMGGGGGGPMPQPGRAQPAGAGARGPTGMSKPAGGGMKL